MALKRKLSHWRLKRLVQSRKRTKKFINLSKAQSVGIIWGENDRAAFEMLKKYLKEHHIQFGDLCYSDQNREITFGDKDFSLFGTPKTQAVNDFINQKFDILIDISLADSLSVQIVRALSLASFKTGWSLASPNFFDFSIDVSQRRDAYYLAEQLIYYLNEIN